MKKKKYSIEKFRGWFIVTGKKEYTFHETKKLALNRVIKELNGEVK